MQFHYCYTDQPWKGSDITVPTTEWIYILLNYPDLSQFKFSLGIVIQGRCYRKKKENEECFYFVIVVNWFLLFFNSGEEVVAVTSQQPQQVVLCAPHLCDAFTVTEDKSKESDSKLSSSYQGRKVLGNQVSHSLIIHFYGLAFLIWWHVSYSHELFVMLFLKYFHISNRASSLTASMRKFQEQNETFQANRAKMAEGLALALARKDQVFSMWYCPRLGKDFIQGPDLKIMVEIQVKSLQPRRKRMNISFFLFF